MKKLLCVLTLALVSAQASARDLYWQAITTLDGGDVEYARQTLVEEFGADSDQWPDWIEPVGLYVPTQHDRLLVVRRPVHEPCGQYRYVVYGVVTPDLRRDRYGEFCGGDLQIIKARGRDWPDLQVNEGRFPDAEGNWQRNDQRLRYQDGQWLLVISTGS